MATAKGKDILTLIEDDHHKIRELFAEAQSGNVSQELFNQIYMEMTLHARTEELVFYPAMHDYDQLEKYIEEAEEEHNASKILLEEMKNIGHDHPEFKTKMDHLIDNMTHHIEEEESDIYSSIRECIGEQELNDLGKEFEEVKAKVTEDVEAVMSQQS